MEIVIIAVSGINVNDSSIKMQKNYEKIVTTAQKKFKIYVKYKKINAVEFIVRYKQSFKETRE